jgi:error-prone DNA polymerase
MVHPYLRRREKLKGRLSDAGTKNVLKKTLGIPLFQEQAMQVAMVCADFSAGEADQLRRAMATLSIPKQYADFSRLIEGMKKKNYSEAFAQRIYQQLEGFGSSAFQRTMPPALRSSPTPRPG